MSIYNYPFIVSSSVGESISGSIKKIYATEASVITDVVWGDTFANPRSKVPHTNFSGSLAGGVDAGPFPVVAGTYLEGPIVRFKVTSGHVIVYKKRG